MGGCVWSLCPRRHHKRRIRYIGYLRWSGKLATQRCKMLVLWAAPTWPRCINKFITVSFYIFFFYISHFFLPFLSLPLLIIILHAPSSSSSLSLFLYFFLTSYPVLKTLLISLYCIHTPHYASHNREILSATRCEQGNTESKMPRFVQPATNRVNFEKENCRRAIGLSVYLCYVFFFLSLSLRLLLLRKNYDVLLLSGMLKWRDLHWLCLSGI